MSIAYCSLSLSIKYGHPINSLYGDFVSLVAANEQFPIPPDTSLVHTSVVPKTKIGLGV